MLVLTVTIFFMPTAPMAAHVVPVSCRRVYRHVYGHVYRHVYGHIYRRALGIGYVPLESFHRGGHFKYRHIYARAVDMPSAMPICEQMLVLTVTIVFMPIAPMVAPVALVSLAIGYVCSKYYLSCMASNSSESGGLAWRALFDRVIVSLVLQQALY